MQILDFSRKNSRFSQTIKLSVEQLASGGLVAIPTETVYGLAGDATNGLAVAKIFEVKHRPHFNPLIAHVSGLEMAQSIGLFDNVSLMIAEKFWPGPLTLVVKKNPQTKIHDLVTAGLDTIAIRCARAGAGQLIEEYGVPLAAPSANRSGRVSPTNASHVASEFTNEDIIILDGGRCELGIESTIASIGGDKITILRAGSVTADELSNFSGIKTQFSTNDAQICAPGMMQSHYAPRSKVILNCAIVSKDAAGLSFGREYFDGDLNLSKTGDLRQAASNLYSHLRELDKLGRAGICVAPIPNAGLGVAINDRLIRAAAPRP